MFTILSFVLSTMLLLHAKADQPVWLAEIEELPVINEEVSRSTETVYRLPINVKPLEYDIYIDLYFAERADRPFSYDGKEYIKIQAVEANVTQITLHANVDSINSVSLLADGITPVALNPLEPYFLEPQYHFLKINLEEYLEVAVNYTLIIEYSNTMNEGPMKRGLWRGWYTDANGVERIYATTHFQPYNARQAFPCWDEPLFKAVFKIHLTRPLTYSATFSNTGIETYDVIGDRVRDNFYATPKMSSYLVTFLVSESFQVIAEDSSFNPPVRIIGRSNTNGLAGQALELSVRMTEFFDDFFQMPYSTLHPHLLNDHISSPDWASAGTENWGMVGYRELYLILDPRETLMSVEHYAATLVSHELAHKWFGNLITCFWWSNTWINEGFASYFGYIAANEMFPRYELHEHFNSRYLQASLSFDSGTSTVPMNHDVNTPAQVTGHFGTISYSKGAAFIRMTVNMITPATFRKACQYFLRNNEYEPTDQNDLYDAFALAIEEDGRLKEYKNFDFAEYYKTWVNVPGYPILKVDVDHVTGEMSLYQERFFLSPSVSSTNEIYPIPITYATKSLPNFRNLKPTIMLSSRRAVIKKTPGEEWVIFNNLQHGHYRVDYDEKSWNLIAEGLLNEPSAIDYLNRAQIVDDVFALMRSQRMTYDFGFNILRFLRTETNYHVWNAAISGYTWLRNRLRHIPNKQAQLDSLVLSYVENVIEHLGYDPSDTETPTYSMTRQEVMHFACGLGHEGCIQAYRERFIRMKNGEWIDARIRRSVYVVGIREGNQADFDFLLRRFQTSNFANDQLEMLRGLGASKDPALVNRYMDITLNKMVRSHDKTNSFSYALLGNDDNAPTVLQYVMNNINNIRKAYVADSPARPVHTVMSNLAGYLDEAGLVEYEAWLKSTQIGTAQYSSTISSINSARTNIAWGTANADTIGNAMKGDAATVTVTITLLAAMAVFVVSI